MTTIRDLRRERGLSQEELAAAIQVRLWSIQGAEFGLGHGINSTLIKDCFPKRDFFHLLSIPLRVEIDQIASAYHHAYLLGDHQSFLACELPTLTLDSLLDEKQIGIEELAEMTGIPWERIESFSAGQVWAHPAAVRRVSNALRVEPLHLETIWWAAHFRCTASLNFRGILPPSRPRRRGSPTGALLKPDKGSQDVVSTVSQRVHPDKRNALATLFGDLGIAPADENATNPGVHERPRFHHERNSPLGESAAVDPINPSSPLHIQRSESEPAMDHSVAKMPAPMTLAEARESKGLTIREMAFETELSAVTITNLEQGRVPKHIRPSTKAALADVLNLRLWEVERLLAASADAVGRRDRQAEYLAEDRARLVDDDSEDRLPTLIDARQAQQPTPAERAARGCRQSDESGSLSDDRLEKLAPLMPSNPYVERAELRARACRGHTTRRNRLNGISQHEAAARCGMCDRAYRHIELGRVTVKESTLRKLAKGFQLSANVMRRLCSESKRVGDLRVAHLGQEPPCE